MDIYESNGLSWADQWDPHPVPSEIPEKKEKEEAEKSKKKLLNFKWMKSFRKKSKNNTHKA